MSGAVTQLADPDPVIAEVVREGFVESVHRGRVALLGAADGRTVAWGAVDEPVLLRSCAKPLQLVGMVREGLDLQGPHLAVASASHDGTDAHLQLVREILAGVGLDQAALDNAMGLALEPHAGAAQRLAGGPDRLHQNCSGKHAAMLATCVINGWPIEDYRDRTHPLQKTIVAAVEELTGEPAACVVTDGCGAPNSAASLVGLARAYARLSAAGAAEPRPDAVATDSSPEGRVASAMLAHPEVVAGEQRDVTKLMRVVPGLIAKDGAEGIYAAALGGRAVALKVADGAKRAGLPVMVAGLANLGIKSKVLESWSEVAVFGHDQPVGSLRAHAGLRPVRPNTRSRSGADDGTGTSGP